MLLIQLLPEIPHLILDPSKLLLRHFNLLLRRHRLRPLQVLTVTIVPHLILKLPDNSLIIVLDQLNLLSLRLNYDPQLVVDLLLLLQPFFCLLQFIERLSLLTFLCRLVRHELVVQHILFCDQVLVYGLQLYPM